MIIKIPITEGLSGKTILNILKGKNGFSSRLIRQLKLIDNGILLNGAHARTVDTVSAGDTLTVTLPEEVTDIVPSPLPIDVLYEDDSVILLNKPPFMPVHPTHNHQTDTLANALMAYLSSGGKGGTFHAINRLDRDTSGIVVAARNQYAASRITLSEKLYLAVAEGELYGSGTIDAPICRPDPLNIRRAVGEGGERAVTHWRSIGTVDGMTLLEVRLETGRTHQIRVHFLSIGHPLVGDTLYGSAHPAINRQALHCARVSFLHPMTREALSFESELPDDMKELITEPDNHKIPKNPT